MKSLYADLSCEEVFELERHWTMRDEWNRRDGGRRASGGRGRRASVQREREDRERDLAAAEVEVCWCKFFESCSLCFGRA